MGARRIGDFGYHPEQYPGSSGGHPLWDLALPGAKWGQCHGQSGRREKEQTGEGKQLETTESVLPVQPEPTSSFTDPHPEPVVFSPLGLYITLC